VDRFTEEHLENQPIFDLLLQALTYLDEVDPSGEPASAVARELVPRSEAAPSDARALVRPTREIREPGEPGSTVETAMRNFELQLLGHLGYAPELMRCVQCQERLVDGENRFSPSSGGVVCANCSAVHPGGRLLSVNAIKAMRLMSQEPFGVFRRLRLTPDQSFEVEGALRSHINFILERQLRTAEFLDRMKADRKRERRQAAIAAV
jgi:DNA repair protein RecO (recombination protein O)